MLPRRLLPGLLVPAPALARTFQERGVALRGTNVVAYFTEARVVRGSTAHQARFVADPGAYAPAYGGFCAWALSQGYTAPTDPVAWRMVEGRLFLNYDRAIQRRWERDIPGFIALGDANWPRLSQG